MAGLWGGPSGRSLVLTAAGANVYGLEGVAPAQLWATRDGGAHWARLAGVPLGQFGTAGPGAFSWRDGRWQGIVSDGPGAEETSDSGRHWATLRGTGGFVGASAPANGLVATWATGADGGAELRTSADGGRTWSTAHQSSTARSNQDSSASWRAIWTSASSWPRAAIST